MTDSVSNIFTQTRTTTIGNRRSTVTGPRLPSSEEAAVIFSGGKTQNLFLAGFDRVNQGLAGLDVSRSQKNQAQLIDFEATQETLKGQEQAGIALQTLNDVQAANIVAAFASGITASGSATRAQTDVAKQAAFTVQLGKAQTRIRSGALKRRARQVDNLSRRTKSRAKRDVIFGSVTAAASLFLG